MLAARLILDTTANVTGSNITDFQSPGSTFQAIIMGTGAVATTVDIQCSLDGINWLALGTLTLSGTDTATDGFVNSGEWLFYRAVTSATTGTVNSIKVIMTERT